MKKNAIWWILGSVAVVGATAFILVKANKNKLLKKQWQEAGEPVSFEEWKKMTDLEKADAIAKKVSQTGGQQGGGEIPSLATTPFGTLSKLDLSPIAGTLASLFKKKGTETALTADASKYQEMKEKGYTQSVIDIVKKQDEYKAKQNLAERGKQILYKPSF